MRHAVADFYAANPKPCYTTIPDATDFFRVRSNERHAVSTSHG
jgi:hypothetical protein